MDGNTKIVPNIHCFQGNPVTLLHVSFAVKRSVLVTLGWFGFNYYDGCCQRYVLFCTAYSNATVGLGNLLSVNWVLHLLVNLSWWYTPLVCEHKLLTRQHGRLQWLICETIQSDSKLLSVFPWPNFQTGNKKIKLLTKYESVPQKVLLLIESILQNVKQLQHALLSWHVRCPSGIQFPSKCLQHLRCNCFDRNNNSELQFIEGGHRGLYIIRYAHVNKIILGGPYSAYLFRRAAHAQRKGIPSTCVMALKPKLDHTTWPMWLVKRW
jgi:hypothetical protein